MPQPPTEAFQVPPPTLAWGLPDNLVASSVYLFQPDLAQPMTVPFYLDSLAWRLAWMMQETGDPKEAMRQTAAAFEKAGIWTGQETWETPYQAAVDLIAGNPAFLDQSAIRLPPSPFKVRQMPAAVQAIRDTTLGDWLDLVLAGPYPGPQE